MGITNSGSQTITFDYRHPAKGADFNLLTRDVTKPGVYKGLTIFYGGNLVTITSGVAVLNCEFNLKDNLQIKIDFGSLYSYGTILPSQFGSNEVLYIDYEYGEVTENYADYKREASSTFFSVSHPNSIVLGELVFDGLNNIIAVDYSRKTWGSINADNNWTIPDQLVYHDTDNYSKKWKITGGNLPTGTREVRIPYFTESYGSMLITNSTNTTVVENNLDVTNRLTVGKFNGRCPLSSILGVSNSTYAPVSGVVNDDGWMRSDGSIVPSGNILAGWTTPNLSDSRFLLGFTSPGSTGGQNSYSLTIGQLPSHTHDMTHTHSITDPGHNHAVGGMFVLSSGNSSKLGVESNQPATHATKYSYTGITINSYVAGTEYVGSGDIIDNTPQWFSVIYLVRVN